MSKNDRFKGLDTNLADIAAALRRCRIAKTALAGLSSISSAVGTDTLVTSTSELQAAADQLCQRAEAFRDRARTIHTAFQEANGPLAGTDAEAEDA